LPHVGTAFAFCLALAKSRSARPSCDGQSGNKFIFSKAKDGMMTGKGEEVKGRIKEAAGALTGNDKLRAEGQADQAVGKVKQVATKAIDAAQAAADAAAAKARNAAK
jgi:uncharacterized protein YjbJ (UPF0337 family)